MGLAGGCASSLDATPDFRRAEALVKQGGGGDVDWNDHWSEEFERWDGSSPLTSTAAVAMALRNNRELRAQVEQIAAGRADLVQAGLLPNPVIAFSLRAPIDPTGGVWLVGATVVQQFTALWLRPDKIRAADARLNQTVLDVSDKGLRLVADVRAAHARLAFGQRELEITRQAEEVVKQSIAAMKRRIAGGEATALDVARLDQQRIEFETEEADLVRRLAKERRMMLELIGFPAADAEWAVEAEASLPDVALDEPTVIKMALEQRLDVAASRAMAEAASADLSVEELDRLKQFGVGIDLERDTDGTLTLGPIIEAEIPIFDTNEAQIAKAGALARSAYATSQAVAQRAVRQARQAHVEAVQAAALAKTLSDTAVPLATRVSELAAGGVAAGVSGTTVLLEAQSDLLAVQRTLVRRQADAALAAIELQYAIGGGRIDGPSTAARAHSAPLP